MKLGVITDVHIAPLGSEHGIWHSELLLSSAGERYSAALAELAGRDLDGIVVLGDLTNFGDEDSFDELTRRTSEADVPVLLISGNHDVLTIDDALAQAIARAGEGFTGRQATEEATTLAGMSVTGVDVRSAEAEDTYAARALPAPTGPSIVLSHFPVVSLEEELAAEGLKYSGDLVNRAELEAAIRGSGAPTLVLSGHLHVRTAVSQGNVLQISFGPQIEAPFDVSVLEVEFGADSAVVSVEVITPENDCPSALVERETGYRYEDSEWVRVL